MDRSEAVPTAGGWTGAERRRLAGIGGAILLLHVLGITLYLFHSGDLATTGGLAGAGVLAYLLGVRHAFDADHIAAIDDTTRLMLLRGRRPLGVGFFFAMGHSTVVLLLSVVVALGAAALHQSDLDAARTTGALLARLVALIFLLVVAVLNAFVLRDLLVLRRNVRREEVAGESLERLLAERGIVHRLLGSRIRSLIKSSWHMYPVGLLMGLGLETASEVALLGLAASAAAQGGLPLLGMLSLPLLFAAGMSTFDTADSLLMTRVYSWSYRDPARTLFFNTATTAMTVVIAGFVAAIYFAALLTEHGQVDWLDPLGALAEHFELLGYGIAAIFALCWGGAALWWRLRGRGSGTGLTPS
ncbi:HoxN/HupN/NixA family nickel/cobalt transporter [Nonomuraea cavernae]|uniref:HoxN/HupN/NixA family nickel/cobalt transporter n=1 Tax=Nonomuraea cavernae TaxID=2045107 RepID=UPI0033E4B3BE